MIRSYRGENPKKGIKSIKTLFPLKTVLMRLQRRELGKRE